jgi:4-hydroxy-tetrahydrodipicolinate synthase
VTDGRVLEGVFNITPTPFRDDGTLDLPSVQTLVDFVVRRGVDGITILGVMGEADKLIDRERDELTVATLDAARGRIAVCVGATHAGTDGCVAYCRRARELGADAVMVAPPRLARPTDAALRRHYLEAAGATDLPIVVQDHPPSSNVIMSVEFLAAIADEAASCRFVKLEDEPTPPKIGQLIDANPAVRVFGGLGGMMFLEELRRGAVGIMTGFGFPEILVQIHRAFLAGDDNRAAEVFYRHLPLVRFENQAGINLAIRKRIYCLRGAIATARARQPASDLDAGGLIDLDDLLTRLRLKETS